MRIFTVLFLLIAPAAWSQQNESLIFNEIIHDFGTIREDAGNADFEFTFTNNSGLTVILSGVKASCGCTTPGWTREPIPPGKNGFVKASFNPKGRPGYFNKTLTLKTNLDATPVILQIKGTVTNDETEKDNNRLSYRLGRLQFKNRTINFGKVYINKPAISQEFDILNSSDSAVRITEVKSPQYISVSAPASIEPGSRVTMVIKYDPMLRGQYGFASDKIELITDDKLLPTKPFSVYATIEEFFPPVTGADAGKIPVLALGDESVDFGPIGDGLSVQKEVSLKNSGKQDLTIRFIQANCACVQTNLGTDIIKAGESTNLTITWRGEGRRGTQNKAITVYSTDPINPVQRISLSGQVN
jgi:hypothetical protein